MKISFYPRVINTLRMRIFQGTKHRFFHRQKLQPPLQGGASSEITFFCIFFIASKIYLLSQECISKVLNPKECSKGP